MPTRRQFLELAGAATLAAPALLDAREQGKPAPSAAAQARPAGGAPLKAPRLKPGDTIGLIGPAGATFETLPVDIIVETLGVLGLKVRHGAHVGDRYGYLAGKDQDRAADVNAFFADPSINGILALRGGWGCARMLPYLDFAVIRKNPKVLLGYSDLTALLLPIHARTGLITFHGPVGISKWNQHNVGYIRRVLFDAEAVTFENLKETGEFLVPVENRIQTITPGIARGKLLGGNLSVLAALVGTGYLPDWDNTILFLEDVSEAPYRIDRMFTQLALAGVLKKVRGVIFGNCTDCNPGDGYGSLTIEEVLRDHLTPLGVPAWRGAMFGHIERQFTLAEGVEVEIDATRGSIRMLEPGVA